MVVTVELLIIAGIANMHFFMKQSYTIKISYFLKCTVPHRYNFRNLWNKKRSYD